MYTEQDTLASRVFKYILAVLCIGEKVGMLLMSLEVLEKVHHAASYCAGLHAKLKLHVFQHHSTCLCQSMHSANWGNLRWQDNINIGSSEMEPFDVAQAIFQSLMAASRRGIHVRQGPMALAFQLGCCLLLHIHRLRCPQIVMPAALAVIGSDDAGGQKYVLRVCKV